MKHVLIATDGSESADEALDFAIEIARDAGATLHVLSVRPPQRSPYDEGRLRATLGVDLLVVGSRGHSLSEGSRALGGVAQALVRNSPVPVTVVHHAGLRAASPARDRVTAGPEAAVQPWSMFE